MSEYDIHRRGAIVTEPGDVVDVEHGALFGGARNVVELDLGRQGVKEEQGVNGVRPVCFPAKYVWRNMNGRDA